MDMQTFTQRLLIYDFYYFFEPHKLLRQRQQLAPQRTSPLGLVLQVILSLLRMTTSLE